jgi:hypothetical protein
MSGITFDFTLKGEEVLRAASKEFRKAIPRVAVNAMRRVLRRRITVIKKRMVAESGVANTIWGKGAKSLGAQVTLIKPRGTEEGITTGIKLKGLAAMIEQGGTTAPHPIKAKNADRLVFLGTGKFSGGLVMTKTVNHPGSRIRPHGIAARELQGAGPDCLREVSDAIAKLRIKIFGTAAA